VLETFVVVVDGNGQRALCELLTNDVIVQIGLDFCGRGQIALGTVFDFVNRQLVADDFVTQVNAFVTNKDRRACDEFFDLVLALAAKRAVQRFLAR
jgi:hypothetical protein